MTKQELNRDIKRLWKRYENRMQGDTTNWSVKDWQKYTDEENALKQELKRLYYADDTFSCLTLQSVKMMILLNNHLRGIALHLFGHKITL